MCQKNNIEYDTVYNFDLTDHFKFGDLSNKELENVFKDGRAISHFLQEQAKYWFPSLIRKDTKEYDFLDGENNKYEMKCFTKKGCKFCPSNMIGKGRKKDENRIKDISKYTSYIICDVTSFPTIQIVFKKGKDLLSEYPKASIKYADRKNIFK